MPSGRVSTVIRHGELRLPDGWQLVVQAKGCRMEGLRFVGPGVDNSDRGLCRIFSFVCCTGSSGLLVAGAGSKTNCKSCTSDTNGTGDVLVMAGAATEWCDCSATGFTQCHCVQVFGPSSRLTARICTFCDSQFANAVASNNASLVHAVQLHPQCITLVVWPPHCDRRQGDGKGLHLCRPPVGQRACQPVALTCVTAACMARRRATG